MTSTDWKIPQGNSDSITIDIKDYQTGDVIDITGATLYFSVKKYTTSSNEEAVISKVITNHIDAVNGKTEIELTKEDTNIPVGKYHYDVVIDWNPANEHSERQQIIPLSAFEILASMRAFG